MEEVIGVIASREMKWKKKVMVSILKILGNVLKREKKDGLFGCLKF